MSNQLLLVSMHEAYHSRDCLLARATATGELIVEAPRGAWTSLRHTNDKSNSHLTCINTSRADIASRQASSLSPPHIHHPWIRSPQSCSPPYFLLRAPTVATPEQASPRSPGVSTRCLAVTPSKPSPCTDGDRSPRSAPSSRRTTPTRGCTISSSPTGLTRSAATAAAWLSPPLRTHS